MKFVSCKVFLLCLFSISHFAFGTIPKSLSFKDLQISIENIKPDLDLQSSFDSLAALHNQEVKIRGFLYETPEGKWILAAQPNLKTCCLGSQQKLSQQIFIEKSLGSKMDNKVPVNIQGRFLINPIWDNQNKLTQLYQIKEAVILPEKSNRLGVYITMAFMIAACLGAILLLRR